MTIFHSIFKRFSRREAGVEDVDQDVADLWPSPPQQYEDHSTTLRQGVAAGKSGAKGQEEVIPSEPMDMPPGIKRDADTLMYNFMQRCLEIAVGEQIKEQALKHAKEKLDAAVAFHDRIREDYSRLCHAVGRVSSLRPWYRSEKYLAETRIEVAAKRGPVKEEDFWVNEKRFFDEDEDLKENLGPFETREVVTRWDERSWSIRSFDLLTWEGKGEDSGVDDETTWSDSDETEVDFDDEPSLISRSVKSLRSFLRKDLKGIPSHGDDDGSMSPPKVINIYPSSPWPRPDLTEEDRQEVKRLCERRIDPRRSSLSIEERASLKDRYREENHPVTHLWDQIGYAQADHNLSSETDATQVSFCTDMIRTITEIEIEWEVYKEATAAERTSAQLLALRLQWELNGSKSLKKSMEAEIGGKRQEQMDLWQDIICAAELRGSPVVEERNIFGSILEEEDQADILVLCPPKVKRRAALDDIHDGPHPGPLEQPDTELFGPMDSGSTGLAGSRRTGTGPVQAASNSSGEDVRTTRLDSMGFSAEDSESSHAEKGRQ